MPSQVYFEDVNVGDEMPRLVKKVVNEVQLVKYAGASGDFNPLHTVDAMGKMAGFDGVIAHGMLIMGFVGQAITDWLPNRCLKKFGVRFTSPTKPKEVITVTGKVVDKIEDGRLIVCEIRAANQEGEIKISGRFTAALPAKP
jgi:acyl dehydratase